MMFGLEVRDPYDCFICRARPSFAMNGHVRVKVSGETIVWSTMCGYHFKRQKDFVSTTVKVERVEESEWFALMTVHKVLTE